MRTSGFRLAEEGWLTPQRKGRRSRYSLSPSGLHRVEHAYRRIYDAPPMHWNGKWTLVILNKSEASAADRVELRRELGWEGFGLLAPGIFLHPAADIAAVREVLDRLKLARSVAVLQAHELESACSRPVNPLAAECWNLELVADHYRKFLRRFQPALERLDGVLDSRTAFVVQTLLVHSFRRVVLHDPRLPAALLPAAWPGHSAYTLCREIYLLTCGQAQTYLAGQLEDSRHKSFKPNELFYRRFGGLDGAASKTASRGRRQTR